MYRSFEGSWQATGKKDHTHTLPSGDVFKYPEKNLCLMFDLLDKKEKNAD